MGVYTLSLILDILKIKEEERRGEKSKGAYSCLPVGLEGEEVITYKGIGECILNLLNSIKCT